MLLTSLWLRRLKRSNVLGSVLFYILSYSALRISRASYLDGKLSPIKAGLSADPKPCAGNDGTTITVRPSKP